MAREEFLEKCPNCGERTTILGTCKVCWQPVCMSCGNYLSSGSKKTCIHTKCYEEHPEGMITGFKFIKFRKD